MRDRQHIRLTMRRPDRATLALRPTRLVLLLLALPLLPLTVSAQTADDGAPPGEAAPPEATPPEAAPQAAPAERPEVAPRATASTARITLKVVHPDEVRRALQAAAEPLGGFPVLVEDRRLILKVPPEALPQMVEAATGAGLVMEKALERADLTGEIAQLEALLRSKEAIFVRLRTLVDDADAQATLRIEKTMSSLVAEMEGIAGKLRVERARARHAVVDISFQFRQRQRIVYVRSPFEWLNSVDLGQFDARF